MGKSDPGPQKYKVSDCKFSQQDKYWTELVYRANSSKGIVDSYNTTPVGRYASRHLQDNSNKIKRSKSEQDFSVANYEYYLKHNLYIKSAVEKQNVLSFQVKKVSIRDYTPKILTQEANMGMWI